MYTAKVRIVPTHCTFRGIFILKVQKLTVHVTLYWRSDRLILSPNCRALKHGTLLDSFNVGHSVRRPQSATIPAPKGVTGNSSS
jgi:hypothetical protein